MIAAEPAADADAVAMPPTLSRSFTSFIASSHCNHHSTVPSHVRSTDVSDAGTNFGLRQCFIILCTAVPAMHLLPAGIAGGIRRAYTTQYYVGPHTCNLYLNVAFNPLRFLSL